jgi:hypothetical protein
MLREGIDYYMENGKFVLTADFLKRRGYCCTNGCRNCPYGFNQEVSKSPCHKSISQPFSQRNVDSKDADS